MYDKTHYNKKKKKKKEKDDHECKEAVGYQMCI